MNIHNYSDPTVKHWFNFFLSLRTSPTEMVQIDTLMHCHVVWVKNCEFSVDLGYWRAYKLYICCSDLNYLYYCGIYVRSFLEHRLWFCLLYVSI